MHFVYGIIINNMQDFFSSFKKINQGYRGRLRTVLLFTWIKILIKNRFIPVSSSGMEGVLGFKIKYGHRGSFYGMFKEIFIDQNYSIASTEKMLNVIDCGSNIGLASIYFRVIAPNSKVLAFEPNPVTFSILSSNIEGNNLGVELINSGLGISEGQVPFYTDIEDSSSQSASLTKHLESKGRGVKEISVRLDKLSKYITRPVDFLKLDIEGSEGDVLEDLLATGKLDLISVIFVEYHNDGKNTGFPLSRMLEILEQGNFKYEIFSNYGLPFAYWEVGDIQSLKITAWK